MAKFEKHMMYGDGKAETADTFAEHLKLKKKGYGHEKPSGFKMRTPFRCWKGYERVPGTKEFSDGSCRKA